AFVVFGRRALGVAGVPRDASPQQRPGQLAHLHFVPGDTAFMRAQIPLTGRTMAVMVLTILAACGRGGNSAAPQQAGGRGAPPAAGVTIVTLQSKPIEKASEFIGTVRSLHSTTIQPQVDG